MSLTYTEIMSQYAALRKTFEYMSSKKDEIVGFYRSRMPKSLTYTGCGSSYCLCQSGDFSAKVRLGIPSATVAAGDLMLNYKGYGKIFDGTMLVVPSRSGSTSEVLKVVENVKSRFSAPVLSICCVCDSELSKASDFTLELPWAFDESVCQTRSVVNLYTAILLIAAYLSGDAKLEQNIDTAIRIGDEYIKTYENRIRTEAEKEWSDVVILADGEMQGIASEAAIAFTEIAKVPGHYYHVLDVRHGPMVLVNNNTLVIICLTPEGFEYQKDLVNDIMKRGARVVSYSSMLMEEIQGVNLRITSGVELDNAVRGIPFIYISQALACFKAEAMGINPDKPDGLEAWIKL